MTADCEPVVKPYRPGWVWCEACERWYPPDSVHAAVIVSPAPTRIEDDR